MRRLLLRVTVVVTLALAASGAFAVEDVVLTTPDGGSIGWAEWLEDHGRCWVLLWATWAPDGEEALAAADKLRREAAAQGNSFVVIAVQEPFEDSRKVLEPLDLPWLNDRHGGLLKRLRVFDIPTVAVVTAAGGLEETRSPGAATQPHRGGP